MTRRLRKPPTGDPFGPKSPASRPDKFDLMAGELERTFDVVMGCCREVFSTVVGEDREALREALTVMAGEAFDRLWR